MALDLGSLYGTIGLDDGPFNDALDRAIGFLQAWGPRGAKVAAVAGGLIVTAIGASIVQGMDLEAGRDKLAAELGLTEADSARIGKVAGAIFAQNYGESMDDVNGAIASVVTSIEGMADASNKELQAAAINALNFAKVFDVDVARSSQIAGQLIKNGLAKDATEAFDLMVTGIKAVPRELRGDLLDALDEYGPSFAQLGMSGEQAFAMLVEASAKGMYGIDKTGDAIKEFALLVSTDLTRTKPVIQGLGLDYDSMANDLLAGGDRGAAATGKIVDALLGMKDPASQARAAVALFGTPIEDLNTSQIPEFLQSLKAGGQGLDNVGGAAVRLDERLNNNAVASLGELKRQAQVAFIGLGNWALPALNSVAAAAADKFGPALEDAGSAARVLFNASQAVFAFIGQHQTTIQVIAGIIGALLIPALIAWGVQATIAAFANVAAWASASAGAAMSAGMQIVSLSLITAGWLRAGIQSAVSAAVVAGAWVVAGAQAMASALRMAAAWLIAIGPIGLAIAAVAGVVVLIVKHWDAIKSKTAAVWDWVVSKVRAVPRMLVSFFQNFTLPGLMIKHWDKIKSTVSSGVTAVVKFVRDLPSKIKSAVGNLGSILLGAGKDIMNGLLRGIDSGFAWVRSKLSGVGRLIPGWLKKVLGISSPSKVMRDQVGQWIPAGIAEGIEAGTPALRAAVEAMGDSVVTPITAAPSYQARQNRSTAADYAATGTDGPLGAGQGGPAVVQHVHPTEGMSERQVADMAANQILFALGNG